jgi:hypothetical protein
MAEETKIDEEFKEKTLDFLKKEEEKFGRRAQEKFEITQKFSNKVIVPLIGPSGEIKKTTEKIKEEAEAWLRGLQKYFAIDWEQRKISEINTIPDQEKKIRGLQKDLFLILSGFIPDKGYESSIVALEDAKEKLSEDFAGQKQRASDLEKKLELSENKLKKTEGKLDSSTIQVKEIEGIFKTVSSMKGALGYINFVLGLEFSLHFLEEVSKFSIPGIDIKWDDEGIKYIFSSGLHDLRKKADFQKLLLADVKAQTIQISDMRIREEYNTIVKNFSAYARDSSHINNISRLRKSLSEAKFVLNLRKNKELVWCGNYSKPCSFICVGFTPDETYCREIKNSSYSLERLDLLSYLIDEVDSTLLYASNIEKYIRKKGK